jgi:chlorobactene glucosyltransferase
VPATQSLLLALPWLLAAALAPILIRRRPRLRHNPVPDPDQLPLISVIVPARNEADNIAGITATLLSSDYRRFEIILVDDRSTDGTREIARRLAANHPERVRLVEGETLPAGWIGKCWACWQGYQNAAGDIIVFTDADTRHHPALLGHTVGALQAQKADLVTVFPRQLMFSFWERVVQPHVFTAIMLRYRDGNRINRTQKARDVIANGQFMAFTRVAYEAIHGHEGVRAEVVEDLRLAQRTVNAGRRLYISWADDLIATRMYRSLRGIIEGWSKNLARASRHTVDPWLRPVLPWLIAFALIAVWVVPPLALLASLFLPPAPPAGWSATATLASLAFWTIMHAILRVPIAGALLYPLGAIFTAGLFVRSALLGESVTWKGRTYGADAAGK